VKNQLLNNERFRDFLHTYAKAWEINEEHIALTLKDATQDVISNGHYIPWCHFVQMLFPFRFNICFGADNVVKLTACLNKK